MKKILFRCNVGKIVGTGHLMEILILNEKLKQDNIYSILLINKHKEYLGLLKKENFDKIEYLEANEFNNEINEYEILKKIQKKYNVDLIILDLFNRNFSYYKKINDIFSKNIIILDTQKKDILDADVVINFSIYQKEKNYKEIKFKTKYFIGEKYFILPEKIKNMPKLILKKNVKRIFLNQGGSDPYQLTVKLLNFIKKNNYDNIKFEIVVGGAVSKDNHKRIIEIQKRAPENFRFYYNINLQDIYKLMLKCDLAITAAGNTLYELSFLGIPCIIVGHHDRHQAVAEIFQKKNCAINLGIGEHLTEQNFIQTLDLLIKDFDLRKKISKNAKKLIDGKGINRIIEIIRKKLN